MKYIGHTSTKNQIKIATSSAERRNTALPHMLFAGAAGCGKTSLSKYIAKTNRFDFLSITPEDIKDVKSALDVMERLNCDNYNKHGDRIGPIKPSIIFIDEIHRMALGGEEALGIAMEEFVLPGDEGKVYWLPYFTLIGATTDDGKLSKPFRDRFKLRFVFEPYGFEEIMQIISVHAKRLEIEQITYEAAFEIAKRGRGVPRIVIGYLERVRDYAYSLGSPVITQKIALDTFKLMGIDNEGLTLIELKILKCLFDSKVPVGLDNLALIVNEAPKTLQFSAEPFLIQKGLIVRSGRGRILTQAGKEYLENSGYIGKDVGKAQIDATYVRK